VKSLRRKPPVQLQLVSDRSVALLLPTGILKLLEKFAKGQEVFNINTAY
jgi:hypothetical protein